MEVPTNITKTGLDAGGVEHHTDRGAERLRGEVVAELSADDTGVTCFSIRPIPLAVSNGRHDIPCARVTLPQITRMLEPRTSRFAR